MAGTLPTCAKTWIERRATITAGATLTDSARAGMRSFVNALIDTGKWACHYSCDSATAGSDGDTTNRWDSDTDLVWNSVGSAHSWMVLRNALMGWEVLITLDQTAANPHSCHVFISQSATFTGGSTTTNPSATDQFGIDDTTLAWSTISGSSNHNQAYHVYVSSDGECTRVFWCRGGVCPNFWIIDKPRLSIDETLWTDPVVGCIYASITAVDMPLRVNLCTGTELSSRQNTTNLGGAMLLRQGNSQDNTTISAQNGFVTAWDICDAAIFMSTTNGRGIHGTLYDLWFTSGAATLVTGDCAPADASRQFALFGDVWHRNPSGTAPVVSP